MKNKIIFIVAVTITFGAQSQNIYAPCECNKDFAFVTNYLENHYSGFATNVTAANRKEYDQLKLDLSEKAKLPANKFQCQALIRQYLDFFRDNHLSISVGNNSASANVNESLAEEVKKFKESEVFTKCEKVDYDSAKTWIYLSQSSDPIEGIYESGPYQVAVVKNANESRDYYGIITSSKTVLWEKGQVKIELKKIGVGIFQSILYMRNHSVNGRVLKDENPMLSQQIGFKKIFPTSSVSSPLSTYSIPSRTDWFYFKSLDDSTNYLYIGTFDGALKSKFDSAYEKTIPLITMKPNLIVDIRSNGGGSDGCWREIAKYLYTDPFPYDNWEYFASSEIIKRYEEDIAMMKKNRKAFGTRVILNFKLIAKKLKKAKPGTFVSANKITPWILRPIFNSKMYRQKKIYASPKKVVLMYNRRSGSAAEGLILDAQHSKKTITFGENSGGYIAFGNLKTVKTPSGLLLNSATHRVLNRVQYEKVGIPPQVKASNESDWIEQAQALFKILNKR